METEASDRLPREALVDDPRHRPFSLQSILIAIGSVLAVVMVVVFAAYHTCGFEGCPDIDQVSGFVPDEASVVVDRDGEEVGKLFRVNRVIVDIDSLPEHVAQAFIATEDREFYEHSGVDVSRVFGAAWQNLRSGSIAEGFSTITMQVARNVFPEKLPVHERTLARKISEVKVARQLESRYDKGAILSLYLNQIYFGSGAWGIEAAAQEYFGKRAQDLTLGEAALLAGLPQAPSRLNPRENMDGALERRRSVLRRMAGQGFITAEEAEEVGASEPDLARSSLDTPDQAAYFMEHVRRLVEQRLGDRLYTGGFTVHTTLDLDAQEVAESELSQQLRAIESGSYGYFPHSTYASVVGGNAASGNGGRSPYLQGALLIMSVQTGDVLAMIGGRDFDDSKYNRAVQARRQPGSAFKPFVYATALQAGYPPTMQLEDSPYRLVRDGQVWEPSNYDGGYAGQISLREALVRSQNIATIRLAEQVGIGRIISTARTMGLSGDIPNYPSVAIGAAEVTLEDMVAAYAAFAALGERPQPRYVTHVTDRDGAIIWQEPPQRTRVMDRDVAFLTVDLMRDVINRGTGTAVRAAGFSSPAAGKTGTTNESADVWFLGVTPEIAAGVWIGMDRPQRIMSRATGGRLAAPVWGRVMRQTAGRGGDWSPPPGVERHVVDAYGNVVGSNCPTYGEVREEWFLRGTVSPYDCQSYRYTYGDSLDHEGLYDEDDESWWRRLRSRIFDDEPDTTRTQPRRDTIIMGPPEPRDTIRMPPPPVDTVIPRPDSPAEPLGQDTILPDLPPPQDTSGLSGQAGPDGGAGQSGEGQDVSGS